MKKLLVASVGATMLGVLAFSGFAQKQTQDAMRKKLDYAQGVLEGLTLQKYELAVTNASLLRDMSQTNAFSVLKNVDYLARSSNFLQAVDGLISAAKSQDLERATEAYTRVARSCVQCHETFRRDQFTKSQRKVTSE